MVGHIAGGGIAPVLVGSFVLQKPVETEDRSDHHHERNSWNLSVTILSVLCVIVTLCIRWVLRGGGDGGGGEGEDGVSESTKLLKPKPKKPTGGGDDGIPAKPEEPATAIPIEPRGPPPNKKLVVLVSSLSTNPKQKSDQDRAAAIVNGLQIGPGRMETVDGAAPGNKEKRNELFALSGIRAKYPQFFLIDGSDKTMFLANFDDFEAMNEMGTLMESINLAEEHHLETAKPIVESATTEKRAVAASASPNRKLIVLISSFSANPRQKSDQDRAATILIGSDIGRDRVETIDGADPANKERRNELFALSGIRATYPQFFLVDDGDETTFFADFEGFEAANEETGSLRESLNLPKEKDPEAVPESIAERTTTTSRAPAAKKNNEKLLVLISSFSANPRQKANQDRAAVILNGLKIGRDRVETVDGAAPGNKDRRNELFELSGIRAKYPQFFLVDNNDKTTFFADSEGFEAMNETGSLRESLNLAIDTKPELPEPVVESTTKERSSTPPSNEKLVVLVSSLSTNPRQKADQDRAFAILNGLRIPEGRMESIDGAAPGNKERRNELFSLSGIRAKYPQFFLVDGNDETTFFADSEGFEAMNETGSLRASLNLAVDSDPESATGARTLPPTNKKLVVLVSSFSANPRQKADQDRATVILKGMQIPAGRVETVDGAVPASKEKRNELFELSGIRAKYPQFFLVDDKDETTFFADFEAFEGMNETGSLKQSLNLAEG